MVQEQFERPSFAGVPWPSHKALKETPAGQKRLGVLMIENYKNYFLAIGILA